jgi:hypothetical protein
MPVAKNVAEVEEGPLTVQVIVVDADTAAETIEYPDGNPPCSNVPTSVQLATAPPLIELMVLAALFSPFTAPRAPATALVAALCASGVMLNSLGTATAARMPKMLITMTNSMMVNPPDFIFMHHRLCMISKKGVEDSLLISVSLKT